MMRFANGDTQAAAVLGLEHVPPQEQVALEHAPTAGSTVDRTDVSGPGAGPGAGPGGVCSPSTSRTPRTAARSRAQGVTIVPGFK
jgi:hypothetical protein